MIRLYLRLSLAGLLPPDHPERFGENRLLRQFMMTQHIYYSTKGWRRIYSCTKSDVAGTLICTQWVVSHPYPKAYWNFDGLRKPKLNEGVDGPIEGTAESKEGTVEPKEGTVDSKRETESKEGMTDLNGPC